MQASLIDDPQDMIYVDILVAGPLNQNYSYKLPAGAQYQLGQFVEVPFAGRKIRGVIWGETDQTSEAFKPKKIKEISKIFAAPPMAEDLRQYIDWVADYTLSPRGNVLKLVMRNGKDLDPPKPVTAYRALPLKDRVKMTKPRHDAYWHMFREKRPMRAKEIKEAVGTSPAVLKGLVESGFVEKIQMDGDGLFGSPDLSRRGKKLTDDQQAAADQMISHIGQHKAVLLDGVTGSGKTEVYLEAVAAALAKDETAQALILLPEIALTLPFIERLAERFGVKPAPWHSDMTPSMRRLVWRRVADGNARLVIGARSALFLPFANLQCIVVDEEHDAAYKQSEGVLYHGRDMAVARGALAGFPVYLTSATPAIETYANAQSGRYDLIELPSRFGTAVLPDMRIVDLRKDRSDSQFGGAASIHSPVEKGDFMSPRLQAEIAQVLARDEQSLMFLNRRGYAPLTICQNCGNRLTPPDSDTWLVEHKSTGRLVCHHTGYSMPKPDTCPTCQEKNSLVPCGPGVERIAEETKRHFPDARVEIFSSDNVASANDGQAILDRMHNHEIDILVATQMAAKGHHFPDLTLVGIVDADLGLMGGDLRAAERTWQVLSQVAGRAGRAAKKGKVLMQSYNPDHPVIQWLAQYNRDGFMQAEMMGREMMGYPPFGRLASVILASENEVQLNETAAAFARNMPMVEGVQILGPAPAQLYRLKGTFRLRFLVKTPKQMKIQNIIRHWQDQLQGNYKIPSAVRVTTDIDPYNL